MTERGPRLAPAPFPDTLSVGARVAALNDDRMLMEYRVLSTKLDKVAAEGEALVFAYDFGAGRRANIRDDVRAAIIALEGRQLPRVPRTAGRIRCDEPESADHAE